MKNHDLPYLLVSDNKGNIFEDRSLYVIGREATFLRIPSLDEFIKLPKGSDLFYLPNHIPFGINVKTGEIEQSKKGFAVAAFIAPAHVSLALPAWKKLPNAPILPLFAYTLVGYKNHNFYVTAIRIDKDPRQDPCNFDQNKVIHNIKIYRKKYQGNRLIEHLAFCATEYLCPAARNYFLNRWEAPLPTSPKCNCSCLGCISLQPKSSKICASQQRIKFIPTPEEIAQIAVDHLNTAPNPIVSFGQGCEGEPLMVFDVILESIKLIRKKTSKGVINLNTNGSYPELCAKLFEAGLDSIRVSINSFRKEMYEKYFKPKDYTFEEVLKTMKVAREMNKWCSINYFVLPGYNNHPDEFEAFCDAYNKLRFSMVQWRNFNIDPDYYDKPIEPKLIKNNINIKQLILKVKKKFPSLHHGYYNPGADILKSNGYLR